MALFLPLTFLTLSYFGAFYSVNVMFKLPMQFVPLGVLRHPPEFLMYMKTQK